MSNPDIKTIGDARLTIEEDFESNYKPEKDILDYIKEKQSFHFKRDFNSP